MDKIILFDADGVAIAPRKKYFSQRLSEDYGVPVSEVMPLFKNEFNQCLVEKLDIKDVLKNYVVRWNWTGSIDDLLTYWWNGEKEPNTEVLNLVTKLRQEGIKCYLATDQEKYRAQYLMEKVGLKNYFDGAFFSCDLGVRKTEPAYWQKILQAIGNPNPQDVEFWDDEQENVDAAKAAGIDAHLFTSVESLSKYL